MKPLPFPAKVLDQHTIVLGKTRSGKSSKMRLIVEHLLDKEDPVCVVTPKDDWWGLKSSADGKTAGYPIIIFGGKHADIPINAHSGAHVAELVATGNRPCIVSLEGLRQVERNRFFIDFAESFFLHTRGTRWLVIDECHNFVPKGKVWSPDQGEMLYWGNRLASEGQGKGIILLSASQRPQKVHNDYLTSHETLIACRVIHKADRDAIKDWVDGCGDPVIGKEMIGGLAEMQRPEAWVWSPEIGFGPKRITFPMFRTYDSFKPQNTVAKLKGWAAVDLEEVKGKLATVVEEAAANDPALLKKEIGRLTAALAKAAKAPAPKSDTDDSLCFSASDLTNARRDAAEAVRATIPAMLDAQHQASFYQGYTRAANAIANAITAWGRLDTSTIPERKPLPAVTAALKARTPAAPSVAPKPAPRPQPGATAGLRAPQRRVLASIGFWASVGMDQPTRAQVAGVAGYSPSSGGFNNLLGQLNSAGLITIPASGRVGLAPGAPYDHLDAEGAKVKVLSVLSNPEKKLVQAMVDDGGGPMARDGLAAATEYSPTSGGFNNLIGGLCTLTIFEKPGPGQVQISNWAREVLA